MSDGVADRCFRCGYDLRGIDDAQACPECGLLAGRSRRRSERLHDAPPGWLRCVSAGLWLILLALAALAVLIPRLSPVLPFAAERDSRLADGAWGYASKAAVVFALPAVLLGVGVWLLTRNEPAIDLTAPQRRRRRWLRAVAWVPLAAAGVLQAVSLANLFPPPALLAQMTGPYFDRSLSRVVTLSEPTWIDRSAGRRATVGQVAHWYLAHRGAWLADGLMMLGGVALSLLLFGHLRTLAERSGQARLVEHCGIVAWGLGGTLVMIAALVLVNVIAAQRVGETWVRRSAGHTWIVAVGATVWVVFAGWAVLTLARAAQAFAAEAHERRALWRESDRSEAS